MSPPRMMIASESSPAIALKETTCDKVFGTTLFVLDTSFVTSSVGATCGESEPALSCGTGPWDT